MQKLRKWFNSNRNVIAVTLFLISLVLSCFNLFAKLHNTHGHYSVRIGKPIPWETFDKEKTPMEWANFVREQVYNL